MVLKVENKVKAIEPAREIWRRQRREKIYDAICWIVLFPVLLFALVVGLVRGLGVWVAIAWMFIHSSLPWWILTPAAIAAVAGFAYLFKKNIRTRIRPNQKFLD